MNIPIRKMNKIIHIMHNIKKENHIFSDSLIK